MANATTTNPRPRLAGALRTAWWLALLGCAPLALTACGTDIQPEDPAASATSAVESPADTPLTAETREGPVTATVKLSPAAPRLGDALVLTLTVEAEPGVVVDMPAFGDALGRLAIVDFTPRHETTEDGTLHMQRYTLQVSASGRQRIPRLRVEFLDERRGQGGGTGGSAGAARPRELLTDELGFQVASVLPEGEVAGELRPARPALAERKGPWAYWPWALAAAFGVATLGGGIALWLRHAAERARLTAFDRAVARLDRLQRAGLPDETALDAWYVELSDIVRRYIEERFALRAPELTTEEFLFEAGRSALSKPHRALLSSFLENCDRVKFARYHPGQTESRQALDFARRFLTETRHDAGAKDGEKPAQGRPARPGPQTNAPAEAKA